MNADELKRVIAEEVRRALEAEAKATPREAPRRAEPAREAPRKSAPAKEFPEPSHDRTPRWLRGTVRTAPSDHEEQAAAWGLRDLPPPAGDAELHVKKPRDSGLLRQYARSTPSLIGVGRAGTRYLTDRYIHMRGEHAVAKDAVESELPPEFAASLGAVELHTDCKDRQEYLLYPDHGRRLHADSLAKLRAEGTRGADVQVIVGDGLSAWAALANAPALLPALDAGLKAAGFSTGRPLVVRFARVGVQDPIGVELHTRATVILVGERPGLGTGDSLSIYIAWGPALNQDNALKNCISNVRPRGIQVDEAVRQTVAILRRAAQLGRGGVAAQ